MWIIFKDSEMFSVRRWGQISMSSKRLILLSHKQTFLLIFVVRIKKSPNWQIYLFFVFFHCIFSTSDLDAWKSYLLSLLLTERIRHHLLFFFHVLTWLFLCVVSYQTVGLSWSSRGWEDWWRIRYILAILGFRFRLKAYTSREKISRRKKFPVGETIVWNYFN